MTIKTAVPIRTHTVGKNKRAVGYYLNCDCCGMYIEHYIKVFGEIYGLHCAERLGFISEERRFNKR